jgi:hypothetical protein
MSNVMPLTKQKAREDLQRACAEFEQRGGKVSRDVGQRVQISCGCCSMNWMTSATWAIRNTRHTCLRCGSGSTVVRW